MIQPPAPIGCGGSFCGEGDCSACGQGGGCSALGRVPLQRCKGTKNRWGLSEMRLVTSCLHLIHSAPQTPEEPDFYCKIVLTSGAPVTTHCAPIRLPPCLHIIELYVYRTRRLLPRGFRVCSKRRHRSGAETACQPSLSAAARHSWLAAEAIKSVQTAAASGRGMCRFPVPGQWQSTPCHAPREGLGNLGFQADFWFLLFSDKRNPPPGRWNSPSRPAGRNRQTNPNLHGKRAEQNAPPLCV